MSKNVEHKHEAPMPASPKRPGTSGSDTSTTESYGAVELISDAEEDEPDVEAVEEEVLATIYTSSRPSPEEDELSWAGLGMDGDMPSPSHFFENDEDHIQRAMMFLNNSNSGEDTDFPVVPPAASEPERHVRFADELSESESTVDSDDNFFPDIFLPQDHMASGFRRILETQDDNISEGSFYESAHVDSDEADEAEVAIEVDKDPEHAPTDRDSDGGSSGYESTEDLDEFSEGETTEEDIPLEAHIPTKFIGRAASVAQDTSDSEDETPVVRRKMPTRPLRRAAPKLVAWVHDTNKPYAVHDKKKGKIVQFNKHRINQNRVPQSLSPTPAAQGGMFDDGLMLSNSASLMMSAFQDGQQGVDQTFAIPAALFAGHYGALPSDSTNSYDEDEDLGGEEHLLNMEEFIYCSATDSADEGEADGDEEDNNERPVTADGVPLSTPVRPTEVTSEDQVHPLLQHLTTNNVGAFRRDQRRHDLLSRSAATTESLAFSGPVIRGIKQGRLEAVNTPITPARKKRHVQQPSSPLVQVEHRKRNAPGAVDGPAHKRQRSADA